MPVEAIYEQTLVIRSQLGDELAFEELLKLYGPRLLTYAQRMMPTRPEALADVLQETWIAIYRALPRLLDPSKFRPWAFRIARDKIYREFRHRDVELACDETELQNLPYPEEADSTIDTEQVHRCLKALSPEHREALWLRFFETMDYDEIAEVTGVSLGTVRSRIHYAKQALKQAWEKI